MSGEQYLVAIDVGSHTIKLVVAKLISEQKVQILALVQKASAGVKKGGITDMGAASDSLMETVQQAESIIGLPIRDVVVGVSGGNVGFTNSEGLIIITRTDNEVTREDVARVIQDSLSKAFGLQGRDREILHAIPRSFAIDNQTDIRSPVGMVGSKLECKTLTISVEYNFLRNFSKVFSQIDLEIIEKIFTPLATSEFLLSSSQKRAGAMLVDIGFVTTSYIVWENQEILCCGTIPIGSYHITADLSLGLQTSINLAEEIKIKYLDFSKKIEEGEKIEMFNPDTESEDVFDLKEIHYYTEPRVVEIFKLLNLELKKINRNGQLPGGVVLVGGGSSLEGIVEIAKRVLHLPVFKHSFDTNKVEFITDYDNDPAFFNAIALAAYYLLNTDKIEENQKFLNRPTTALTISDREDSFFAKLWDFIKKLLPWS